MDYRWIVECTPSAAEEINKLDKTDRDLVTEAVGVLSVNPEPKGSVKDSASNISWTLAPWIDLNWVTVDYKSLVIVHEITVDYSEKPDPS